MKQEQKMLEQLLAGSGIVVNGPNPWDPQIHNEDFYGRVLRHGSLGLGESYMDGWWDCENLDQFFCKLFEANIADKVKKNWGLLFSIGLHRLMNPGRKSKAFEVGIKHYDIGNDLYQAMLGKRMAYTCAYWKEAKNLDEAQEAKLDLICKKIGLKPGQRILDIGSGWGSFTGFAAEKYGAHTTGVTVSKEQKALTDQLYKDLPVQTLLQDYRDIKEKFDHIVSVGMFEHVGYKNYRTFMKTAHNALADDGLFLLHTIGSNESVTGTDPWIEKYIFPNGMLPSIKQIGKSIEGLFVMEDWHNLSVNYDKTLMAWHENFEASWDSIKQNYNERFYRMWRYYLLVCAGLFRARKTQLWQIVLSKKGVKGGYKSVR